MGGQLQLLQASFGPGDVVLSGWLRAHGISPALAARYVRSGWLAPLGHGAWQVPGRPLAWTAVVQALQAASGGDLRPQGHAALRLLGLAPLALEAPVARELVLSGATTTRLPAWAAGLRWPDGLALRLRPRPAPLPFRSHDGRLRQRYLEDTQVVTVDGRELLLPTPERALLELLDACREPADFTLARQCVLSMPLMRRHLQSLLAGWPSFRTRRLLRWLLLETGHALAQELKWDGVDLGKGKRVLLGGGRYVPEVKMAVPPDLFADPGPWERCAALLGAADKLLVLAGNGARFDVGDVTYHVPASFQAFYPAYAARGLRYEDFLHSDLFREQPRLAWGIFAERLNRTRAQAPSVLARILQQVRTRFRGDVFVFTTNVDGDALAAGLAPQRVMEKLGSLHYWQCFDNCCWAVWPAPPALLEVCPDSGLLRSPVPTCPHCGGLARPNVKLWHDVARWETARADAQLQHYRDWLELPGRLLVLELGAGRLLPDLREESRLRGGPHIRVNLLDADVEGDGVGLAMDATAACARLFAAALPLQVDGSGDTCLQSRQVGVPGALWQTVRHDSRPD